MSEDPDTSDGTKSPRRVGAIAAGIALFASAAAGLAGGYLVWGRSGSAIAASSTSTGRGASNSSIAGRPWADVAMVELRPIPEGPAGTVFVSPRHPPSELPGAPSYRPLDVLDQYAPRTIPAPLDQGGCTVGGDLILTLIDGQTVTYGPCRRPPSIDHLWAGVIDVETEGACRPNCGPGGVPGP